MVLQSAEPLFFVFASEIIFQANDYRYVNQLVVRSLTLLLGKNRM
ncbi:MAG: hypothetical protein V7K68_02385 [Nostoc sp.]